MEVVLDNGKERNSIITLKDSIIEEINEYIPLKKVSEPAKDSLPQIDLSPIKKEEDSSAKVDEIIGIRGYHHN